MTEAKAKAKPRGLGRGLNALFEDEEQEIANPGAGQGSAAIANGAGPARGRIMAGVEQLSRNEDQPRTHFDEEALQQLASSLKEHGMLQPIVVRRKTGAADQFEIIAGERRWRAAQIAQMHEVPVNIVEMDDQEVLEVALIENLQREDLNAVEEAMGYQRLLDEYNMTQEDISKAIGKSRAHVGNTVRLLNLPQAVLDYLRDGRLSAGHARALIPAANAGALAREIVEKGLTVRQVEEMVAAQAAEEGTRKARAKSRLQKDADTVALEHDITNVIGMKVAIDTKNGKAGTMKIAFKSLDQLDDLIHRLSRIPKVALGE